MSAHQNERPVSLRWTVRYVFLAGVVSLVLAAVGFYSRNVGLGVVGLGIGVAFFYDAAFRQAKSITVADDYVVIETATHYIRRRRNDVTFDVLPWRIRATVSPGPSGDRRQTINLWWWLTPGRRELLEAIR